MRPIPYLWCALSATVCVGAMEMHLVRATTESVAVRDVKLLRGLFPNHQNPLIQVVDLHRRHPDWWTWFPQTMSAVQKTSEKHIQSIGRVIGREFIPLGNFFDQHPPKTSKGWLLYKQLADHHPKHRKRFDRNLSSFLFKASLGQFLELYPHLKVLSKESTERLIAPLLSRLMLEGTTKSFSDIRGILEQWNPQTPRHRLLAGLMSKKPETTVLQDYAEWRCKNAWDPLLSFAMIQSAIRINQGLAAVKERLSIPKSYVGQNAILIAKLDNRILKQLMQEGQDAASKGQTERAQMFYNQAIKMPVLGQTTPIQYSHLGHETVKDGYWTKGFICFMGLKDYGRALDYFTHSSHHFPASVLRPQGILKAGPALRSAAKKGLDRHDVRALFWAGLCCEYLKKPVLAKAYYDAASIYGTYWYGQLACWKLNRPINLNFANPVVGKRDWQNAAHKEASRIIELWKEEVQKKSGSVVKTMPAYVTTLPLCKDLLALAKTPGDHAKVLEFIDILHPSYGVESAKGMAKTSNTVFRNMYPVLPNIRCADPALIHSIILTESCFQSSALSWVHAIGIMQIMKKTAQQAAKDMGIPLDERRLYQDVDYQISMGTHIITTYMKKVGSVYPPGIAAYNAGVHRAIPWIQNTPDLEIPEDGIIWIESIPFKETHHYVLRVMESYMIYRSLMGNPVRGKEWDRLLRSHPKTPLSL